MTAHDAAKFLAGSPDRLALLDHLRETPAGPREVADALDVAHRSAQRNLAELVERGWAERREGDYHLTPQGHVVARTHADYVERLELLEEWSPFLRHLPDADHVPPVSALADADLVVATDADPQAPVTHYVETVPRLETDRIRMVSPVLSRLFQDAHAELVARGVRTDLVLDADTVAVARERNPEEFRFVLGVPGFRLFRHPERVSMGLTLGDDRVLAGAYDDEGGLRALLDSRSPDLLRWARARYRAYREGSERLRVD